MVEYKTKLLGTGKMLDVSEYRIIDKDYIQLPDNIIRLERDILPSILVGMYRKGIYLPNKKEALLDRRLCISNDSSQVPVTLDELENNFKNNPKLEYFNVCKDGLPIKKILDFENYTRIKNFLSEKTYSLLFTEELLLCLETYFMCEINDEKDLIFKDFSNISSHLVLVDEVYKYVGNLDNFLKHFNFTGEAFEIVKFEYFIFYMDILEKIKKKNPLSVRLTLKNNNIVLIEYFASPSSRRYNLNKNLVIEDLVEDDGGSDG